MTIALVLSLIFAWVTLAIAYVYTRIRPVRDLRQMLGSCSVAIGLMTYLVLTKYLPEPFTPIQLLSSPFTIAGGVIVGCLLYRFRGTSPLAYGMLEIYVGVLVMTVAVISEGNDITAKLVGIVGSVYIIVRGFDNAERGLPDSVRQYWHLLFPKRT